MPGRSTPGPRELSRGLSRGRGRAMRQREVTSAEDRKPAPRPKRVRPREPGPRMRRPLSNPGGAIELHGDREAAELLRSALQAQDGDHRQLTHGFHSYPARMHPALARICVRALSQHGERVLDPFCGSGTVLIEAMLAGRFATGVDLNPIATRVAHVQSELRDQAQRARFMQTARAVVAASLERVQARVKVHAPLDAAERARYQAHVLLELAGLHEEIGRIELEADRLALQVAFSALVVKFSRQAGDTTQATTDKRIRKGLVSEFFERKCQELVARWAALSEQCDPSRRAPLIGLGDARALPQVLGAFARFDLVLSSPPYGGTYDYHAHHARRYPWFGLDARRFERDEVGARRRLSGAASGEGRWEDELAACLRSMSAVTRPLGLVALLMGDALVAGQHVDSGEQLERLGGTLGLALIASAAQLRPDPRGGTRREHLVLLQRV